MKLATTIASILLGTYLAFLCGGRAVAGEKQLPADLDLVPRNAVGFVHLRAADLYRSELAKDLRYLIDKAGPEAWKAFEKRAPIDPATLDRLTLLWLTPQAMGNPFPNVDPEAVSALVIVATSKPYDRLRLIEALGAKEKVYRGNLYYFNEELWSGLFPIDDRTFLVGSEESLVRYLEMARRKSRTGPLQAPLVAAAGKHQLVLGLNPQLLQKEAVGVPPSVQTLLGAHAATVTLDLDQGIRFNARLDFLTEDQARNGETAARQTIELARQELSRPIAELEKELRGTEKSSVSDLPKQFAALVGLGFLREVDAQLKAAPIQRDGVSLKLHLEYKNQHATPLLVTSLASIFMLGQSANATFTTVGQSIGSGVDPVQAHLQNLGKAFEKYREKHGVYPPAAIHDKDGRPVLSWRVALLPYLGEQALYDEFKLDEPWDSLHNKRLLKKMPKALQLQNQDYFYGFSRWKTPTLVVTGANTMFEGAKGQPQPDKAKQAILVARTRTEGVYWTKPADLSYAADKPLPDFFGRYENRIQVLLTDGSTRAVDKSMNEKDFRALIERSDKPMKVKSPPQLGELETIWNDLTQHDDAGVKKAWQGIAAMSKMPDKAVPFLKTRVKAVPRPDPKLIAQHLADLDSNIFKKRFEAAAKLEALGDLAQAAIDKKLAEKPNSLETTRLLEGLAQKFTTVLTGEELRSLRAVEILEQIGTPEARAVLADLANGGEGVVLTEQARRANARLTQRSGASKTGN